MWYLKMFGVAIISLSTIALMGFGLLGAIEVYFGETLLWLIVAIPGCILSLAVITAQLLIVCQEIVGPKE